MIKAKKLNNNIKASMKLRTTSGLIIMVYGIIVMIAIGFTDGSKQGWCSFIHNDSTRHNVSLIMQVLVVFMISWLLVFVAKELLFCFVGSTNKKYIAFLSIGMMLTQLLPTLCWMIFPYIYLSSLPNEKIILFLVLIIIAIPFVIFFIFLPFYICISRMKNGSKNTLFNKITFPLLCFVIPIAFCFIYYLAIVRTWSTIFILVAIIVSCDTFAYLIGVFFGKHKMAPIISPKKSWEGAIGGIILATLFCLFLFWISEFIPQHGPNRLIASNFFGCQWLGGRAWTQQSFQSNMWHWQWWLSIIIVLAILSVVVVVGDLIFSYFKRKNNIKDFSNFIKGHGGLLDRIDSLIFVILFFGIFTFIIALSSFYIHSYWGSAPISNDDYVTFLFPNWKWFE